MLTLSTLAFFSVAVGFYLALSFTLYSLFSLNKRKREELTRPIHFVTYYCQKGHSVGSAEPSKGEICATCINEGSIQTSACPKDGTPLIISKRTPPYQLRCPRCGYTSERIEYEVEGKLVSLDTWIKHQKYDPIEIPRLRKQNTSASEPLKVLNYQDLQHEWKQLYDESLKLTKCLKQDKQRRTKLQRRGLLLGIIVWIGLLILAVNILYAQHSSYQPPTLIYGDNDIASPDKLDILLDQFQATLSILFVSFMTFAAFFTFVILVLRKRKQPGQAIDWNEFMGSAGLAIFAELTVLRILSSTPPTVYDVLLILMLELVPALASSFILNRRYLIQTVKLMQQQDRVRRWIRKLSSSNGIEPIRKKLASV
jgi:hypothetical protein